MRRQPAVKSFLIRRLSADRAAETRLHTSLCLKVFDDRLRGKLCRLLLRHLCPQGQTIRFSPTFQPMNLRSVIAWALLSPADSQHTDTVMRTISRRTNLYRAPAANRHSNTAPSGRSRTLRPSLLLKPPTLRRLSLPRRPAGSTRSTQDSRHRRRGLRLHNQVCHRPVSHSGTAPTWSVSLFAPE